MAGALLALTSALACACFVKAFGIGFLALPRSRAAADAHELSPVMVGAAGSSSRRLCLALGLFPGAVLAVLSGVMASLPGLAPVPGMARGPLSMTATGGALARSDPGGAGPGDRGRTGCGGAAIARHADRAGRFDGCRRGAAAGALTPQTEYTATAFSKPLMMIFRAVYRPTREVEALAKVSPYFPQEVRYRRRKSSRPSSAICTAR